MNEVKCGDTIYFKRYDPENLSSGFEPFKVAMIIKTTTQNQYFVDETTIEYGNSDYERYDSSRFFTDVDEFIDEIRTNFNKVIINEI
jgi:hypothetical protein